MRVETFVTIKWFIHFQLSFIDLYGASNGYFRKCCWLDSSDASANALNLDANENGKSYNAADDHDDYFLHNISFPSLDRKIVISVKVVISFFFFLHNLNFFPPLTIQLTILLTLIKRRYMHVHSIISIRSWQGNTQLSRLTEFKFGIEPKELMTELTAIIKSEVYNVMGCLRLAHRLAQVCLWS